MGIIKEKIFIAEDALFFKQPLIYSLRCKTSVLAWRFQSQRALNIFPIEVKEDL